MKALGVRSVALWNCGKDMPGTQLALSKRRDDVLLKWGEQESFSRRRCLPGEGMQAPTALSPHDAYSADLGITGGSRALLWLEVIFTVTVRGS